MPTHGTLGSFDLLSGDWKSYVERATLYFTANDINDADKQRAIFLSSCGDATYRRIRDVLAPRAPTEVSFKDICTTMSDHLQPEPSEIVQRYSFNTRVRRSQESVATYVAELKRIAEHCNFGDNARLNEMIRDRLVCGIANDKWKQRLLAEDPKKLNFDKAYSLLLSLEASEKQVKVLTQPEATQVHQLRPPDRASLPAKEELPCVSILPRTQGHAIAAEESTTPIVADLRQPNVDTAIKKVTLPLHVAKSRRHSEAQQPTMSWNKAIPWMNIRCLSTVSHQRTRALWSTYPVRSRAVACC